MFTTRIIQPLLILVGLSVVGCSSSRATVKISYGADADAQTTDARIAEPVGVRLKALSGVEAVVSLSRGTQADLYVVGAPGVGSGRLTAEVSDAAAVRGNLPAGTRLLGVSALTGTASIPAASGETVATVKIEVDDQAANDAGLTKAEMMRAVKKATEPTDRPINDDAVEAVKAIPLATPDGRRMHLGDVAAVLIAKTPREIRRDF